MDLQLMAALSNADAIAANEGEVRAVLRHHLASYGLTSQTDGLGSLIFTKEAADPQFSVMLYGNRRGSQAAWHGHSRWHIAGIWSGVMRCRRKQCWWRRRLGDRNRWYGDVCDQVSCVCPRWRLWRQSFRWSPRLLRWRTTACRTGRWKIAVHPAFCRN